MNHMPAPNTSWARAKIARYQIVRRTPMESRLMPVFSSQTVGTNHVTDAAHGMNQFGAAGRIDLVTQQVHKGVEGIFLDVAVKSPNGFDERTSRHHFASTVHKAFEQIVFRAS